MKSAANWNSEEGLDLEQKVDGKVQNDLLFSIQFAEPMFSSLKS
jgi:hypothetical protein